MYSYKYNLATIKRMKIEFDKILCRLFWMLISMECVCSLSYLPFLLSSGSTCHSSVSFHPMHLLGVISNESDNSSPESLVPSSSSSSYKGCELNSMNHHDLLDCFRRDSNKVQSYLCILPELDAVLALHSS